MFIPINSRVNHLYYKRH